jgi:hypothetical protein
MFFLKFLQSSKELVILFIGDDRGVKDIIPVIVLVDFLDKSFYFVLYINRGFFHEGYAGSAYIVSMLI